MKCLECGNEAYTYIKGNSEITQCLACKWNIATTYHEPIEIDQTIYHVILETVNNNSLKEIKIVSKVNNCNFLDAKKIISKAPIEIFADKAPKVLEIKKLLEENNIIFRITPDFKY